ncbi:4Fe-4S binding protein [Candidatus Woesearchaeota archaeon]|nr:4Fe-4S binding protein [Candidatus Woesearchaeota archaeon]
MVVRQIIEIDEAKCDGCGICIPDCPEGALQIIDGKARLISDLFCDGLGACIGSCPQNAITTIEREAEEYDENKVMENIVKAGDNTIKAHLEHLSEHGETEYYNQAIEYLKQNNLRVPKIKQDSIDSSSGCPGAAVQNIPKKTVESNSESPHKKVSELTQWPIQLNLLPPNAPFFNDSDLLIAADCVGFANPNLHQELMRGKSIAIGCPKLDDDYSNKIAAIINMNDIKSVSVAVMEVPCCQGLYSVVEDAVTNSNKNIPLNKIIVTVGGETKKE